MYLILSKDGFEIKLKYYDFNDILFSTRVLILQDVFLRNTFFHFTFFFEILWFKPTMPPFVLVLRLSVCSIVWSTGTWENP